MPSPTRAAVVEIDRYGPPGVLRLVDRPLPALRPGEVRLRVVAAGVNYTDVQIRARTWPTCRADPFPYTPGIEAVGIVGAIGAGVEGWSHGQTAITMMQGLGGVRADRPGGYAEVVIVDQDALAPIPAEVDPLAMAAVGLLGVTAYWALNRIAADLRGKRILVTGAAGNVGALAIGIAKAQGVEVIGLVSRTTQIAEVLAHGADEVVVAPKGEAPGLTPRSLDGVLDVVGGPLFGPLVDALKPGGVLSVVGAVAGGPVTFDVWRLIDPVVLTGYSTETLDGMTLRAAVADLTAWLAVGDLSPPHYDLAPLAQVAAVHAGFEDGSRTGRVRLEP